MADETTILGLDAASQPVVDDAGNVWFPGDHDTTTDKTYKFSLAQIKTSAAAAVSGTTEYDNGTVTTTATIDFAANGANQKVTVGGNTAIGFTAPSQPQRLRLAIHQDGTGFRLPTFASLNRAPAISQTASAVTVLDIDYNGSTYTLVQASATITDWGASTSLANNAPYIQKMHDAGISTILVPDGVFKITATVSITTEGVSIQGNGLSSVIEMTTGDDVAIDFNGGSAATRLNGCSVRNVWIRGEDYSGTPVEPSGTGTGVGVMARHVNNFVMHGCYVSHHSGNALYLLDTRMTRIDGNFFWENYWDTAWTYGGGADIYTADDDEGLIISSNFLCSNNKLGIFLFSNNEASSIAIDGNVIVPCDSNGDVVADGSVKRSHGIGLFYGATDATVGNLGRQVISDNVIYKTLWNGIYASCDNTSNPDSGGRFLIANNHVGRTGIDHKTGDDSLQGAIVVLGAREASIVDNLIVDFLGYSSTDPGYTAYGAINVYQQEEGCDLLIEGNTIKDTIANGIYVGGMAGRCSILANIIAGQGGTENTNTRGIFIDQTASPRANLTSVTVTASGDLIGKASHGLSNGDRVAFSASTNGLDKQKVYYVINANVNDFQITETPGGTTPVDITGDGSGYTVSDPTELGQHFISGNRIESWNGGIYYHVTNDALHPIVTNNILVNRRVSDFVSDFAGSGAQIVGEKGTFRGNTCHKHLYGVRFSSAITGRRTEQIRIDDNTFEACGYGIRADNDGSGNGLILATNNTFNGSSARIYTTSATAVLEGNRLGNGNIEAWLPAAPTFGTWRQYDVIRNSEWSAAEAFDWVKTDTGEDLYSAATFTARSPA